MGEIKGRFAPSPTGHMHLGNIFAFLLAWLQVRKEKGKMVLRIEDLDSSRSKKVFEEDLINDLKWLGLDWDEGLDIVGDNCCASYRQDERRSLYEEVFNNLDTYPCYCTRAELAASAQHGLAGEAPYTGTCRNKKGEIKVNKEPSYRLVVPAGVEVEFVDLLQGKVRQNLAAEVGDFVVKRADGVHAYQLAVVIDDGLMGVSHVLRGADLLHYTARQIFLYRLLGFKEPIFTHVPLLCDFDGHKLSKRQKDLSVLSLRENGVLPEAIIGYLGYISGLLPEFKEIKPRELLECFSLSKVFKNNISININQILYILSKR